MITKFTMVSVQDQIKKAEGEVKKAREAESIRRKEIAKAERSVRGIRVKPRTIKRQFVLSQKFGRKGVTRGAKQVARATRKSRATGLKKIRVAREEVDVFSTKIMQREKQISKTKKQLREVAEFNRDLAIARKFAAKFSGTGKGPRGLTKRQRRFFTQISEGQAISKRAARQAGALRDVGLTPKFKAGKLIGFESTKGMRSIPLEGLSKLPQSDLIKLTDVGILTFGKKK